MEKAEALKGLILGATGAVGRELVQELVKSPNWSEVTVVVRRKLEEWDKLTDSEKNKLKVILKENLDGLNEPANWNFAGYSSIFCCLGSRVGTGKDNFVKVDYTYPLYGAKIAQHFKIPHYSLVSSGGANHKSWNLYMKTKGQVEEALKEQKLPHLAIMRPGLILERRNDDRFGEKIASVIPFIPKITARDIAKAQRIEAELQNKTPNAQPVITYSNSDLHYINANSKYPENIKS